MLYEKITTTEDQTRKAGEKIAKKLIAGDVVLIKGDLGAGKTVISSGIINALTKKKYVVSSPTFNIVFEYAGKTDVYHFDLYRIKSEDELDNIGIYEYLYNNNAVCLFEWPERAENLFKNVEKLFVLEILKLDEDKRKTSHYQRNDETDEKRAKRRIPPINQRHDNGEEHEKSTHEESLSDI
jgi:tRNA threonylcarbamoyladenosine biosynthesis protein TsaE